MAYANAEAQARRWLEGVGDPEAGEWTEENPPFFHLRRRLTEIEAIGIEVVDVRGTWEAEKRLNRVRKYLPPGYPEAIGDV